MTNRTLLRMCIVVLAAMSLAAGAWFLDKSTSRPKVPSERLSIGLYPEGPSVLLVVAETKGFFASRGLEVIIRRFESGYQAVSHLTDGKVDMAVATEFVFVLQESSHKDLRILASLNTADIHRLIARQDRGIQRAEDLKGKRIGLKFNTSAEFFLMTFLLFHSIAIEEVVLVDVSPSDQLEALEKGVVDAVLTWDMYGYHIDRRLGELVKNWPAQSGQDFHWLLMTSKALIDLHPSRIERFLQALVEAEDFIANHSDEAQTMVAQFLGYDSEAVQHLWKQQKNHVALDQALLLAMEDMARWRSKSNSTRAAIPNYLNYLDFRGLEKIKPEAVTVFR